MAGAIGGGVALILGRLAWGMFRSDLIWCLFVALVVAEGRRFIKDTAYSWLVGCCAGVGFFAAYFAWFAWEQLGAA